MNTITDYSKIILAILAISSISIPVTSQAAGFNPAMRDSGHRSTAAVRSERGHRGGKVGKARGAEVSHARRGSRNDIAGHSGRNHSSGRVNQSRPHARHSGRHYIRHNRPM